MLDVQELTADPQYIAGNILRYVRMETLVTLAE